MKGLLQGSKSQEDEAKPVSVDIDEKLSTFLQKIFAIR